LASGGISLPQLLSPANEPLPMTEREEWKAIADHLTDLLMEALPEEMIYMPTMNALINVMLSVQKTCLAEYNLRQSEEAYTEIAHNLLNILTDNFEAVIEKG
jgi:hypothetical protein